MSGESTLSINYADLKEMVGRTLGYGEDEAQWDVSQRKDVDRVIDSGLRKFLYNGHEWTFLKPVATLATVADQEDYDLPDDFGGMDGPMTYGQSEGWLAIPMGGEGEIRRRRQANVGTARPILTAVRPKAFQAKVGHRFELLLWPKPDAVYNLTYRYHVLLNRLTEAAPYPPGGMAHAETIRTAVLFAAAQAFMEDEIPQRQGAFNEQLAASIAHDQRSITPEHMGRYGDVPQTSQRRRGDAYDCASYNVTVGGTQW